MNLFVPSTMLHSTVRLPKFNLFHPLMIDSIFVIRDLFVIAVIKIFFLMKLKLVNSTLFFVLGFRFCKYDFLRQLIIHS